MTNDNNSKIVPVLLPIPLGGRAFDYKLPVGVPHIERGQYVTVPFGKKSVVGIVWDGDPEGKINPSKIKAISEIHDDMPAMSQQHREFLKWVSKYTMNDLGPVLKLSISVTDALEKPKKIPAYILNRNADLSAVKMTDKRQRVVDFLKDKKGAVPSHEIKEKCDVSQSILKGLSDSKILKIYSVEPTFSQDKNTDITRPVLNDAQQNALDVCLRQQQEPFSVTLIDGVTGSGKTEVFFDLVEKTYDDGFQTLILMPEIALTQQIIDRFYKRFGFYPLEWHSRLTPAQRRDNWRRIVKGEARVIIGARSALFLPYKNLKTIIIDEEHDGSYKQEEGVMYHARDMAVVRSMVAGSHVVLVSATPSLETLDNVDLGKYESVKLESRFGAASMPDIHIIDIRKDRPAKDHWISPSLQDALLKNFERREQSLLFLNRRGYAPLTICRSCGHRMTCDHCSAWLVEHKRFHRLQCHHCGFAVPTPEACPECGAIESLSACGPGVERLIDEIRELIPLAKVVVFSSDNMTDPDILKNTLHQIQRGKFDILIGTQMLAKGHHFPNLTTVGIVDADIGLSGGDLRASERTFQLLHQVSGRAGRESKKGNVYIQTTRPDSTIVKAMENNDRDAFVEAELAERDAADMPPFTRLVSLIISGEEEDMVRGFSKDLARHAPSNDVVTVFGPAPAPMAVIRNQFRYRFLVKAEKNINIQKTISHWLSSLKKPNSIKVQIDVDPQSFL